MRYSELNMVKCIQGINKFKSSKEYVYKGIDKDETGFFIDSEGVVQTCSIKYFRNSRKLIENFVVVAVTNSTKGSIVQGEEYSVYRINDDSYTIFSSSNKLQEIRKDFFITQSKYLEYKEKGIEGEKLKELRDELIEKDKLRNEKEKEILAEKEKADQIKKEADSKKEEKEKNQKFILSVIRTVNNKWSDEVSQQGQECNCEGTRSFKFSSLSFPLNALSLYMLFKILKGDLIFIILLFLVVNFFISITLNKIDDIRYNKEVKKTKKKQSIQVDENNKVLEYKKNETLNKLPLELLGKIKKIELNIDMLLAIDGDSQIISLLKESVSLTLSLNEFSEIDINDKLNEFLDNTLEYIDTLSDNRKVEQKYIKEKLAENISDVIDSNNSLFKSMIKDNEHLNKYIS